ncbi:hypothetical protein C7B77_24625 [Chamaesiphon polymorphus CCALA 037]|uniref:Uncharacterized protein n=1 Tax=Chamaesiphon polymorphus CCALA 037 TaxID=2107692 RepID=A0A2T1FP78_9CYAN|nr:hypothetical protein C7B77_24625 [Chamaesiphon polymorphus CCALA 037]
MRGIVSSIKVRAEMKFRAHSKSYLKITEGSIHIQLICRGGFMQVIVFVLEISNKTHPLH